MEPERVARRHLKPEERRRIAELCERSGLTQSEFAKRHGISLSSLQRWLSEARSAPGEVPAVVFREVAVSPLQAASASPAWAVEIVGQDGVTVRFRERLPIEELTPLLRGRPC
jgi:transposase-like protein